jgi:gluconolactonase
MTREANNQERCGQLSRRAVILGIGAVAGAAAVLPRGVGAQAPPTGPVAPPSTVTSPPRDFSPSGAPTTYFTDPDILTIDPLFNNYVQPNSAIQRLWTGALWSEGPAWSGQGRYLVWSDIPNNRQLRWLEDNGRVSVFRMPSNNSNGNSFDFQGRQLSCEHLMRRVVRYEHDGSVTVLADTYNGKRLNSPNDVVPHPDGSYWFTGADGCVLRWDRRRVSAWQNGNCRPTATASTRAGGWTW